VRLIIARRPATLRAKPATIDKQGRLHLGGTIAGRARGEVRVRLAYVGEGSRVRTLRYRARIAKGAWKLRALLPSQAARSGGQLSLVYAGDAPRGIRGEHLTRRLAP
jgi:hypothetical protein